MTEEQIIYVDDDVDTTETHASASTRRLSFIEKATTVDEKHIPSFIRDNFWAYYNELALTASLKKNDVNAFKYTAEVVTYMQMMQFSRDELETVYDFTSFLQLLDNVKMNLSRAVDAKIYDTVVRSVNEQIVTERTEQNEKKKGVSIL